MISRSWAGDFGRILTHGKRNRAMHEKNGAQRRPLVFLVEGASLRARNTSGDGATFLVVR